MRGRTGGGLLSQSLRQAQQREDDGLLTLLVDQFGLLGRQLRPEQGLQGRRIERVRVRPCHASRKTTRSAEGKINWIRLRLYDLSKLPLRIVERPFSLILGRTWPSINRPFVLFSPLRLHGPLGMDILALAGIDVLLAPAVPLTLA